LIEFSNGLGFTQSDGSTYAAKAVYWSDDFLRQLRKDDWIALVSFDLNTHTEVDFTRDKMAVHNHLAGMLIPGFHESNVFDALIDTMNNLKDVKGRKSIVLLASGFDTLSKHTLDQTYKAVKETDVTIFTVGVGEIRSLLGRSGSSAGLGSNVSYLQAKNQMGEFAHLTGGRSYFPRFDGEVPGDMQEVANMLRCQYSLGYTPTNQARDGKYRKIRVDLVGDDGAPLEIKNEKGKKLKLVVYTRQGYTAPKGGPNS
jgi:VWFA-related protein